MTEGPSVVPLVCSVDDTSLYINADEWFDFIQEPAKDYDRSCSFLLVFFCLGSSFAMMICTTGPMSYFQDSVDNP
eukprot:scaffold2068_cov96-Cylindrotheca_fusiformis.AAC.16